MWFDGQAAQFEDTAGVEPAAARSIAQAIVQLGSCTARDIILDVGAGTGAIGAHFVDLRSRYIGLDRSWAMLEIFRRKFAAWPQSMLLVQAEADHPWPIQDRALAVVFAARVAHHLHIPRFVDEVFRVCRPGGHLLLGQILRDAGSLPRRLQRYKRALLAEHGVNAPSADRSIQQIEEACLRRDARSLPPVTVAQWTRTTSAEQMIARWNDKPRLNSRSQGQALDAEQRADIVQSLTAWAHREFGDLNRQHEYSQTYTLQGFRLP